MMGEGIDIFSKATVLLEALPYIQRFKGSVFVVKYGGSFMDDPDESVRLRVIADIIFLASVGIKVVVVHGGGKAISRAMERENLEAKFVGGLRVTDSAAIKIVESVLNDEVNRDICDMFIHENAKPVGVKGQEIFSCEKLTKDSDGNPIDIGFVGEINYVDVELIQEILAHGKIPVITPTAKNEEGEIFNTNADVAASHVAAALDARRLVYLCDVPGLLKDPSDLNSLISTLRIKDIDGLKSTGVISSGMVPKVDSSVGALNKGVHRVHFIHGHMPHSLLLEIFTDSGIGTEIVK